MDRRLFILALGMFALGTDSFVVAGILPEVSRTFRVSIGAVGQLTNRVCHHLRAHGASYRGCSRPCAAQAHVALCSRHLCDRKLNHGERADFAVAIASRILAGIGAAMFAPTATGAAATLVAPERRGQAPSIVIAGLTVSTALGTPIGAVIAALGDWRWTMAFVSALAVAAALGISLLLTNVPLPPKITLAQRIAPVADPRIALTLLCTWLYQGGHFIVYTYFTVVFDRAIGHNAVLTSALLVIWGVSGTVSNLVTGRLADSIGDRKLIPAMLTVLTLVVATFSWTGATLWTTIPALIIYGIVSWGLLAPQQRRLVQLAPQTAPVVLGLNTSFTYLGVTITGSSWCARHSSIRCPSSWLSRRIHRCNCIANCTDGDLAHKCGERGPTN